MEKHQGQVVERAVRSNGFSITALAKSLNVNRRSLYNWFQSDTMKPDTIYNIGIIIGYDFSEEFPELFKTEQFQEEPDSFFNTDEVDDNEVYKEKYLKLLETYNELLIDAIEKSDAELQAPESPVNN